MQPLDHLAQQVEDDCKAKRKPKDYTAAMLAWRSVLMQQNLSNEAKILQGIRGSSRQSEILEALLLSNCPLETIETALAVPKQVSQWYKELFFDTSVFLTKLDQLVYLEEYPDDWGRDLKIKAVNLGYEFVLFSFANLVPKTNSQKQLIERMFMATAYKAMAMNYNGIKSDINKQAVRHAELMLKAYDLLMKANAASSDLDENSNILNLLTVDDIIQEQNIDINGVV